MTNSVKSLSLENFIKFFFFLCPLLIIMGPAPINFFIIICSFSAIFWKFKKNIKIDLRYFELIFLIFILYLFILNFLEWNIIGFSKIGLLAMLLASLLIIRKIKDFHSVIEKNSKYFILFFIFLIFDGLYQFLTGSNIIGIKMAAGNRVSSFFGEEAILGSFLAKSSLFFYCLIAEIKTKQIIFSFLKWSLIFLYFAIIFLSGERVAFLFSIFILLIYFIKLKDFKKIFLIILTSIILLISILNLSFLENYKIKYTRFVADLGLINSFSKKYSTQVDIDNQNKLYIDHTKKNGFKNENIARDLGIPMERLDELMNNENVETNFFIESYHGGLFLNSYLIFKENFFFGVGIDNYKKICKKDIFEIENKVYLLRCSSHPHNIYLELLAETGIVGFLIFIIFTYFYFRYLFQKSVYLKDKMFDAILVTNLGLFFPLFTTGSFFSSGFFIYYYFFIILAANYGKYNDIR